MKAEIPIEVLDSQLTIHDIILSLKGSNFFYLIEDTRSGLKHFFGTFENSIIVERNRKIHPNYPFIIDFDDPTRVVQNDGFKILLKYKNGTDCFQHLKRDTGVPFLVIQNNKIFIRDLGQSVEYSERSTSDLKLLQIV